MYIITVPNLGNHFLFNIKEENDYQKIIGSNYVVGNSALFNPRLMRNYYNIYYDHGSRNS